MWPKEPDFSCFIRGYQPNPRHPRSIGCHSGSLLVMTIATEEEKITCSFR